MRYFWIYFVGCFLALAAAAFAVGPHPTIRTIVAASLGWAVVTLILGAVFAAHDKLDALADSRGDTETETP